MSVPIHVCEHEYVHVTRGQGPASGLSPLLPPISAESLLLVSCRLQASWPPLPGLSSLPPSSCSSTANQPLSCVSGFVRVQTQVFTSHGRRFYPSHFLSSNHPFSCFLCPVQLLHTSFHPGGLPGPSWELCQFTPVCLGLGFTLQQGTNITVP